MSDHVPTVPEPKKYEVIITVMLPGYSTPTKVKVIVDAHGHTEAGAKAEIVWRKAAEVTDIHVREISKVIVA